MAKLTVTVRIESENIDRDYGMRGTDAIVEANGVRYLIRDGFGGVDSLRGGGVRWEHGMVIQLKPEDTLESLKNGEWGEMASLWDAVTHGFDESRPVLGGLSPENMAKSAGLV